MEPAMADDTMIRVVDLRKAFHLHNQGNIRINALAGASLTVRKGECVVLNGPSGSGKSTLLKSMYANYKADSGQVLIRHLDVWVDMVSSTPQRILDVRRRTVGYVSQFLRVIPRVPAVDVVSEPLWLMGEDKERARDKARTLLDTLNIPERLWMLAPATFSGGEQQRVNIARSFIVDRPVLLLDEPTASLDEANSRIVTDLIHQARHRGAAIVGIFHDPGMRAEVATSSFDMVSAMTVH
jgi:alpha-D-ribose 1-methylphosphonate 5-triphosphate synthase subunit PhnL